MEAGLQSLRAGMASSSKLSARLFAAAGVVLGEPSPGDDRCAWNLLASLAFLFASTDDFGGHSNRKCLRERGAEPVCRCGFSAPAKSFDCTLAHASAGGAALWPVQAWPQHLAKPRSGRLRKTCATQYGHLDGT